jgi:hypothetical protein
MKSEAHQKRAALSLCPLTFEEAVTDVLSIKPELKRSEHQKEPEKIKKGTKR